MKEIIKDKEEHKKQVTKDADKINNLDIQIIDILDKTDNKSEKIYENSDNCEWW